MHPVSQQCTDRLLQLLQFDDSIRTCVHLAFSWVHSIAVRIRELMESQPRLRPVLHGNTQTEVGERFDGAGKRGKRQCAAPWMTEALSKKIALCEE